jgi:hypothetical protein
VFAATGAFLGAIRLDGSVRGMKVERDRVTAWGLNPDDEPTVWVHRIVN